MNPVADAIPCRLKLKLNGTVMFPVMMSWDTLALVISVSVPCNALSPSGAGDVSSYVW